MSDSVTLSVDTPVVDSGTQVVTQTTLTDHDKQMIDKVDGKSTETTPTLLAGKYKDEAALEKGTIELLAKLYGSKEAGYKTLESLLGKDKDTEGKAPVPPKPEDKTTNKDKPLEIPKQSDKLLDFDKYTKEVTESGNLSEASYNEILAKGIPKEIIDGYLGGLKATAQVQQTEADKVVNTVYELSGGKDQYTVMVNWATQNLSKDEIAVLNEGLLGDMAHAKIAAETLRQKFQAANGKNPSLVLGGASSNAGDIFRDKSEWFKAMQDPRYKTSEAYRMEVAQKVDRSKNLFGSK